MNISQHSFVPFTGYVEGYYNANMDLVPSQYNASSNILMPLLFGVNTYQLFNLPIITSSFATLRIFDPRTFGYSSNGILSIPTGKYFSSSRNSLQPFDVRIVGWSQFSVILGLTSNSIAYDER